MVVNRVHTGRKVKTRRAATGGGVLGANGQQRHMANREGVGALQRVRARGYGEDVIRSNTGSAVFSWQLQQGEVAYVAFAVVR